MHTTNKNPVLKNPLLKNPLLKNTGFALLFAVIVMSIVLSIIFSIADISYKQAELSGIGKDSQIAFYAADSGAECAQYWDNKHNSFATTTTSSITCNGQAFTVGGEATLVPCPTDSSSSCAVSTFTYDIDPTQEPSSQAVVTLYKNTNTSETTVTSSGKNTNINADPRQVERSVKLTYTPTGLFCTVNGDILVVQDASGSVSGSLSALQQADVLLVSQLYQEPSNIEVGFIGFGGSPQMKTVGSSGTTVSTGLTPHATESTLLYGPDQNPNSPDDGSVAGYAAFIGAGYTNPAAGLKVAEDEFTGDSSNPADPGIFDSNMYHDLAVSDQQPLSPADNRNDSTNPNYVVLVTDGAEDVLLNADGSYSSLQGFYTKPGCSGAHSHCSTLPPANMSNFETWANTLKAAGIKIIVIDVPTGDSDYCQTDNAGNNFLNSVNPTQNPYPEACDNFLEREISSGTTYFYKTNTGYSTSNQADFPKIVANLTDCS
jgi:Tfp pilus assembly protein PilX